MPNFTIGLKNSDHLTVEVVSAPGADTGDHYNNLSVEIQIKAGSFSGRYSAWLDLHSLVKLRADFHRLYNSLSESMELETMEYELKFEVVGDGRGHFEICGVAIDSYFPRNELHFFFEIDQTFIPAIVQDLDEIIEQFKV